MTQTISLPQIETQLLWEVLSFSKLSETRQAWLVGGSIRDMIAGDTELPDLDIATSFNPISIARDYAKATGAGFVVLDDERNVVRVVRAVNEKLYTFDLSEFRADDIDGDLQARDFTINAISANLNDFLSKYQTSNHNNETAFTDNDLSFQNGTLTLYDPLNGCEHLRKRLIIPCSTKLFDDDPLRLMRAFRFSAIYDAELSPELKTRIKDQAQLLSTVSGERIRDELFKVLQVDDSTKWIRLMQETGILEIIFPDLAKCVGVEQNQWHHLDVFEHSLLTLENLEKLIKEPILSSNAIDWWQAFLKYLDEPISGGRSYKQALKLGALLHDLGKPVCRRIDPTSSRIIFHGHEMEGARIVKNVCESLRLSANETAYLVKITKNHMRPGVILQQGISDKRLFRFYAETGRDGLGISLLSMADRLSALGTLQSDELETFKDGIFTIMNQFYQQLKRPKLSLLLNGNDLKNELNIKPGPVFREILKALEEAQFVGEITTREEALTCAREILLKYLG